MCPLVVYVRPIAAGMPSTLKKFDDVIWPLSASGTPDVVSVVTV